MHKSKIWGDTWENFSKLGEEWTTKSRDILVIRLRTSNPISACQLVSNYYWLAVTMSWQFLQKLNKISRGCKSFKVGLGWSGPIVWDAEDCTLEHTREKLLSQAAAGVAFIFTGRQHKVFFYLSCSAMQPTTWPKTDFIDLGPKKTESYTFSGPDITMEYQSYPLRW